MYALLFEVTALNVIPTNMQGRYDVGLCNTTEALQAGIEQPSGVVSFKTVPTDRNKRENSVCGLQIVLHG